MAILSLASAALSQAVAAEPGIALTECSVYPLSNPAAKTSCLAKSSAACDGLAACELPIGLTLTDGKDISPSKWKHVLVRHACGKASLSVGPYEQNDHATVSLGCARRPG